MSNTTTVLQTIMTTLAKQYKIQDSMGLFLTSYGQDDSIINSHGTLITNKTIQQTVEILYHSYIQPFETSIKKVICYIVTNIKEVNLTTLMASSPQTYGLCIIDDDNQKTGCLLPATPWAQSITQAIAMIKQKHGIQQQTKTYLFTTTSITIPFP